MVDVKAMLEQAAHEYESLQEYTDNLEGALRQLLIQYDATPPGTPGKTIGMEQAVLDVKTAMGVGPKFRLLQRVRVKNLPGVRSDFVGRAGWIEHIRPLSPHYPADTLKWGTHKDGYNYYLMCDDGKQRSGFSCEYLEPIEGTKE